MREHRKANGTDTCSQRTQVLLVVTTIENSFLRNRAVVVYLKSSLHFITGHYILIATR